MSKWSALVYGRTYEVDFRLIAMPEGFNEEDKQWALKYILGTTRSPEKLPEQPRWSLFKNDRYCVVGVTCMVRELIEYSFDENSEDLTKDTKGRPLYVFVGYVAQLDKEQGLPTIPKYCDRNIELFSPLYDYVRDRWSVKSYQESSKVPILSEYKEIDYQPIQAPTTFDSVFFALNRTKNPTICLWPDTDNDRENLWFTAAQQILASSNEEISLCLGLASQRDSLESPFLNATASDIRQKEKISKQKEPSSDREEIKRPPQTTSLSS